MSALTRRDFVRNGAAGALALWLPNGLIERAAAAGGRRVQPSAFADLRKRLTGTLLLPGDAGYTQSSQPANTRFDAIRPAAVAQCADETDVATCIKWSLENGVEPVARGGGHSYAGYSTTTGLLVDLGRLNSVKLDQRTGLAVVGGAALNANVFYKTVEGDFILPGGTCLGVGVGGLVLGGGVGYNTHWAGLTCDHLRGSRIVTAAGDVLKIDDSHHSDLFWACRGGAGGNFGINTSFTFELARVPRQDVAFYRFDYRGADAAGAVLSAFDKLLETAPTGLNAVAMSQATPVDSGGPREAIATFSRGQYIGPLNTLKEIVSPLLAAAKPVTTRLGRCASGTCSACSPAWKHSTMRSATSRATRRLRSPKASSRKWSTCSPPARAAMTPTTARCGRSVGSGRQGQFDRPARHRVRTSRHAHDAPRNPGMGHERTRVGPRRADRLDQRHDRDDRSPYRHESYQNFPNRDIKDWKREYYAENLDRLVNVKTKYDPHNVFRNAQSIPPRRHL